MFQNIEMMQMARAMGQHVAQRQTVVARNIANADTPGYKAQDLQSFEDSYRSAPLQPMRATNSRHIEAPDWSPGAARVLSQQDGISPNGNSVSIEEEMLKAAELKRSFDLSLGIYRSAMNLMRTSIGRRV